MHRSMALIVAALAGCSAAANVGEASSPLAVSFAVDPTPGISWMRAGGAGRFVAYGRGCGIHDPTTPPLLELYDRQTGTVRNVPLGSSCTMGGIFSPDGKLFAFAGTDRAMHVYGWDVDRVVAVTRSGGTPAGIAFSPDSSWFAVSTNVFGPSGRRAPLDAWPADLSGAVEIATDAYASPFGTLGLGFTPDSRRLLYFAAPTTGFPTGTLTLWSHDSGANLVLGEGVPVTGYAVDRDWRRIALLSGVVPDLRQPPSAWLHGTLALVDVASGGREVIAAPSSAAALSFSDDGDRLLWFDDGGNFAQPAAFDVRVISTHTTFTLANDAHAQLGYPNVPNAAVRPDGRAVAFFAGASAGSPTVSLRLAPLPDATTATTPAASTLATDALPNMMFGWTAGGAQLAFARSDGNTSGDYTLAAFDRRSVTVRTIATNLRGWPGAVSPSALAIPLFVDLGGDGGPVAELQAWNPWTGTIKTLARDVDLPSYAADASGLFVGYLHAPASNPGAPAGVSAGWTVGALPASDVSTTAVTFAVVSAGDVVYATPSGVFEALVL